MYKESNLFVYIFVVSCQFFQVIVKICPITLKIGMHSWNPHPPPLIKREVGPSKNWVTWGGTTLFPRKGGGVATLFITLQFSSITFTVCGGEVRFPLLLFRSSVFWVSHGRFSSKSLLRFPFTFSSKSCSKTRYHL